MSDTKPIPKLRIADAIYHEERSRRKIENVWTKKLAKPFTPVSAFFLDNHHRLKYPVTPTEFMLIVHLLRFKWDDRMPFPAMSTLAKKMQKSEQAVRTAARSLERKRYLKRHMTQGRPNHFDLEPLYRQLEVLLDTDAKAAASAKKAKIAAAG